MEEQPRSLSLHYFALLHEQRGVQQEELTTTAYTARALYEDIARRYRFTLPVDKIGVAINNAMCSIDSALAEGDKVVFIPPVSGG
jgi:molybdopterin converting factor small subunit